MTLKTFTKSYRKTRCKHCWGNVRLKVTEGTLMRQTERGVLETALRKIDGGYCEECGADESIENFLELKRSVCIIGGSVPIYASRWTDIKGDYLEHKIDRSFYAKLFPLKGIKSVREILEENSFTYTMKNNGEKFLS